VNKAVWSLDVVELAVEPYLSWTNKSDMPGNVAASD